MWDEVIDRMPEPDQPMRPRTRRLYKFEDFQRYEVVLDVWGDVFAFGVLLVPTEPQER